MTAPRALRHHHEVLSDPQAVVLAAVIVVCDLNGRCTVRDVMAYTGHRSTSTVHTTLLRLRDRGLVTWEYGTRGTLRPLVWPVSLAG